VKFDIRFAQVMEASIKNNTAMYFPALTGVRALAAYMVFCHHFIPTEGTYLGINVGYLFGELHIGVTFFFVLSGFLIHNRYSSTPSWSWPVYRNYFIARLARIIPLFFILTFFTFVLLMVNGQESIMKNSVLFFLNITLLKGLAERIKFSGISQSWSLTVEFCFYLLAPLLFTRIKNVLLYPWVSFILLLLGFGMVSIFSLFPIQLFGDNRFMLSYTFLGRSFEFFAGCFLSSRFQQWSNQKPSCNGLMTYGGLLFVLIGLYVMSLFRQPQIYGVFTFPGLLINNFFLPFVIILFFRGLLFEKTLIGQLLSSNVFQLLGKASYAFYLIHLGFLSKFVENYLSTNEFIVFIIINLISIVLFRFIEEPLNLYFRRHFIRKPVGVFV
jgi:peptidoglycan/LPS O-acetylase OafA/YrhL